jgi:hypothetical protein
MVTKLISELPSFTGPKIKLKSDNIKQFYHCKSGKDRTFTAIINSAMKYITPKSNPDLGVKLYKGLGRTLHGLFDNPGCTGIKTLSKPSIINLVRNKFLKDEPPKGDETSAILDQDLYDKLRENNMAQVADLNSSWNNEPQGSKKVDSQLDETRYIDQSKHPPELKLSDIKKQTYDKMTQPDSPTSVAEIFSTKTKVKKKVNRSKRRTLIRRTKEIRSTVRNSG